MPTADLNWVEIGELNESRCDKMSNGSLGPRTLSEQRSLKSYTDIAVHVVGCNSVCNCRSVKSVSVCSYQRMQDTEEMVGKIKRYLTSLLLALWCIPICVGWSDAKIAASPAAIFARIRKSIVSRQRNVDM